MFTTPQQALRSNESHSTPHAAALLPSRESDRPSAPIGRAYRPPRASAASSSAVRKGTSPRRRVAGDPRITSLRWARVMATFSRRQSVSRDPTWPSGLLRTRLRGQRGQEAAFTQRSQASMRVTQPPQGTHPRRPCSQTTTPPLTSAPPPPCPAPAPCRPSCSNPPPLPPPRPRSPAARGSPPPSWPTARGRVSGTPPPPR